METYRGEKPDKKYAIKAIRGEKERYLVNGWRKQNKYWDTELSDVTLFKSRLTAQASLSRLLKIMTEYKADRYEIIEIEGKTA